MDNFAPPPLPQSLRVGKKPSPDRVKLCNLYEHISTSALQIFFTCQMILNFMNRVISKSCELLVLVTINDIKKA